MMCRVALGVAAAALAAPVAAGAATVHATPSSYAGAVSSAQAGDTILLASGNYGTWTGTSKAITVKADAGASPTMRFDFNTGASGFTVDGVSGGDNDIGGGAHDITIRNGSFSGTMKIDGLNEANVVLDHDTFTNDYSGCLPRVWLPYTAQHDSGVTVQNSRFTAGSHDGIQTGTAMKILNNEFVGIEHGSNQDCHTDNIQLYWGQAADGTGTTIKGNYIHDGESGITQYDGGGHNVIEDNVLARLSLFGFVFGGDKGSTIIHNVAVGIEKKGLDLSSKAGATSSGQTIKDNIFQDITLGEGPPASYTNNLIPGASSPNISGSPVFSGGAQPSTYAAFALAASSPGKSRGSDGLDVGARFVSTPPDTTPPDTTITSAPADPSTSTSASIAFTSEQNATFECKLDAGSFGACTSPKGYSNLSSGQHTFSVRATDAAGNTDATPATWTWTVSPPADTTPPDTTITGGPTNPTTSTSASFTFTSEQNATFECKLDAGAYGACSSPKAYSALSTGSHTFSVRATDVAGNTDATPASQTWMINASSDTTPPETTLSPGPTDPTTSTSASFAFSSNEPGTFECKLDTGAYGACSSPKAYSGLSVGSHTFTVRAIDAAGNVDATPPSQTWTINAPADTTPPNTSISSGPANPTTATGATFGFASTENGSTFACKLDTGAFGACTSPRSYTGLGLGQHTFSVRATDAAGNTDATPATLTWTINAPADTTPPDTAITVGPTGPTNDTTPTFEFTSTEAGSFACRVDAGAYGACTTPWTTAALADGNHSVSVRATDAAGNTDASAATRAFTVDTVAPRTTITSSPPALSLSGSGSVAFTVNESGARSECRLDGGAWAACTSPYQASGLGIGSHQVDVHSTDAAGNVESPGASASWTVVAPLPGAAPTVTLTAPTPGATVGPTARFAADATSTRTIKRVEFWVDSMRVASDPRAPYDARVDLSWVRNGMHTVAARVFNIDGQTASTAMLVRVSRKVGRARAAAVLSAGSPALLGTLAAGPGKTQIAGQAAQGRMLQATLARCNDPSGKVVGGAQLRADGAGHLTAMRTSAGLCVMGISLPG